MRLCVFFLLSLPPIFLQCCFVQLLKPSKFYFFVFSFFFIVVVIHFLERNICWWQEGGGGSEAGESEKINVIFHLVLLRWVSAHKKLPPAVWSGESLSVVICTSQEGRVQSSWGSANYCSRARSCRMQGTEQLQLLSTALSLAFSPPFGALLVWQFECRLVPSPLFTRAHEKGNGVWCC